jgi:ketosteroid isomerase-like protein
MKIIISFLATAFLAALTFAQEESASPAESTAPTTEEKASATVEETPAASAAAPAGEKKAEPVITPKPAASPAEKKEAAAASTTAKAAPAAAAMNTKGMSVKDMENAWEAAVASHNSATIEGMIAGDFVGVSSKNKFIGRSDELAEFKGDKDTYKSAKNEKLNVKNFGPNVTVVTGRAREKGTGKDGKPFDRTFLFTDTWMLRGGQWQCVASQSTKIKG